MVRNKIAKLLLEIQAVTFRFNPPYTYTSGLRSPIYLDNRLIISYPTVREKVIGYYVGLISESIGLKNVDWISGTATAAIPHAAFIADRLDLPMVYVRSSAKKHGKGEQIEGYLKKRAKVLIIEDHISTGVSSIGNAKAIREAGGIVEHCVATTSYETEKSVESFKDADINLHYLVSGKQIVDVALQERVLSQGEKESVDLWFDDPPAWAEKVGV